MADPLTKLSSKYGCDKSDNKHKYTMRYHRYFKDYRKKDFKILEFGFGQGKSVKMWLEYFTKARLVTVDKMEKLPNDRLISKYVKNGRFEFVSADQIDMVTIMEIFEKYGQFDLIIDDASHVAEDQQYTFGKTFGFVKPAGYYVIEDLKCPRNHSTRFKCQSEKTLKILKEYLKTGVFYSQILSEYDNLIISENITSLAIFNKIAFIERKK